MIQPEIKLYRRNLMLHWISADDWYASRGYKLWRSSDQGKTWVGVADLQHKWAQGAARLPLAAQIGRLGIHNFLGLTTDVSLCIADGVVWRSVDRGMTFAPLFSEFHGRRPLRHGFCLDGDGRVYLGEYWVNEAREAVRLWRSEDNGASWQVVHEWPAGAIRHIHFVQFDRVSQLLWVGTGDYDAECAIAYSADGGITFQTIGQGSQLWRAVSLLFMPEALFWGTDAGIDAGDQENYLVRWDRATQSLRKIQTIDGPAYYSTQLADGTLALGTAVEGGRNEKDGRVHLYWSKDGNVWQNISLWKKWPLPERFGHAILTFPQGDTAPSRLFFNAHFVWSRDNNALFEMIFSEM
ncbi:MAG TPA: hypothetical protein EYP41_20370 [Anaerolineae bacterium]|nr:hypothetical protein [Anaerolineae bacterium]